MQMILLIHRIESTGCIFTMFYVSICESHNYSYSKFIQAIQVDYKFNTKLFE